MPLLKSDTKCPVCSATTLNLPEDFTDESSTTCANCGAALGKWGTLKDARGPIVSDKAEQSIREALKHL